MDEKQRLRTRMRQTRRAHVQALPDTTRALLFMRPPGPVARMAEGSATIGLYHATPFEVPTGAYARWFAEHGHAIALPWFADRSAAMTFRLWQDPFGGSGLEHGPYGPQPEIDSPEARPDLVFVPLLAFAPDGGRLGQGAGHYDRWLASHAGTLPIGLAWDCQLVDDLPREDHDIALAAVVTPTRIWQGTP